MTRKEYFETATKAERNAAICRDYATGATSFRKLGKTYKLSGARVEQIVRRGKQSASAGGGLRRG